MESFDKMVDSDEKVRELVSMRINEVERIVGNLHQLRQNLLAHAYQAKQSVLSTFNNHRSALQTREMDLLNRIDTLLQSKDNAMVTQLSKLNQVLGCLRNCQESHHPCDDCLEKFEDIDFDPISEISMDFSAADQALREAIDIYGEVNVSQQTLPRVTYDAADITSWLLIPTNVKAENATSKHPGSDKTEWLTQNLSATHSAPSTDEHFLHVRSAEPSTWLTAGVESWSRAESVGETESIRSFKESRSEAADEAGGSEAASSPPSLYSRVLTEETFAAVARMSSEDWLRESSYTRVRERSVSVTSYLSATSSAPSDSSPSSYAPSATASVVSSGLVSDALAAGVSPDSVSVATTDSFAVIAVTGCLTGEYAEYQEWLSASARGKIHEVKSDISDWVVPSKPSSDWSAQSFVADDWLPRSRPDSEWMSDSMETPTLERDWLLSDGQASLIGQLETLKLKGNFLAMSEMEFYSEKADVPKSPEARPRLNSCPDNGRELVSDWLAGAGTSSVPSFKASGTIAHMKEILAGSDRDWVLG